MTGTPGDQGVPESGPQGTPAATAGEGSAVAASSDAATPTTAQDPAPERAAAQDQAPAQDPVPTAELDAPATPQARDTRPKPEFGEYAPEGWEWKPEGAEASPAAAPAASPAQAGSAAASPTPATVQGVPHNLGAGIARPSRKSAAQGSSGAPYRAPTQSQQAPQQAQQQAPRFQAPAQGAPGYQKPANMGDRIVTILLLVFGGFGALQSAFAMMGMSTMFSLMEDAPGITSLTPPGWLDVTGKAIGLGLLVLYGLVLVFSIRRLRAGKITFWAPLAAGVLAFIIVVAVVGAAMMQTPELMEIMRDPQASTQLLEYLQGFPAN
ncbi:hypothetical protein U746_1502 [Mycolicibacterium mucogenicum 261Sha1.1M5]|nr:hypothetical protein U746_1502 [Mycolicibacterium mucogenicum 261Sha1.1M5]